MVAVLPRPRIAMLLASLFLFTALLPLVPVASAQLPGPVLVAKQGGVELLVPEPPFLEYGAQADLYATVLNYGADPAPAGFPIYWHASDHDVHRRCVATTKGIPAASGATPGSERFFLGQVRALPGMPENITIRVLVNQRPDASNGGATYWNGVAACGSVASEAVTVNPDPSAPSRDVLADHIAWGYAIVNHTLDLKPLAIRWCQDDTFDSCTEQFTNDPGIGPYNSSSTPEQDRATFFIVDVFNDGNHSRLHDLGHARCAPRSGDPWTPDPETCWDLPYRVQLRVTPPNGGTPEVLEVYHEREFENVSGKEADNLLPTWAKDGNGRLYQNHTMWVGRTGWSLVGRAGVHQASADVSGVPDANDLNNLATKKVDVLTYDLRTQFGDGFQTSVDDPYPHAVGTHIRGKVHFHNNGTANALSPDTRIRWYVDTPGKLEVAGTLGQALNAGTTVTKNVDIMFSSDSGDTARYLSPGQHVLVAEIDYETGDTPDRYNETNEANNTQRLTFYIEDLGDPVFVQRSVNPLMRVDDPLHPNHAFDEDAPNDTLVHPHQPFEIKAWVDDEDDDLDVVANFSLKEGGHSFERALSRVIGGDSYLLTVGDFDFHDPENVTGMEQNWTVRVNVTDATGNSVESTLHEFKLRKWPLHNASGEYLVVEPVENGTVRWDRSYFNARVHLPDNVTGIEGQYNVSTNLHLVVDPPGDGAKGAPFEVGSDAWSNGVYDCETIEIADRPARVECEDYPVQTAGIQFTEHRPGRWNLSITIDDVSGANRTFNRSFDIVDDGPVTSAFDLTDTEGDSIVGVNAGQPFNVTVSVKDDSDVAGAHLNLSRPDGGAWMNVTLADYETEQEGTRLRYWFNATLDTGRATDLGLAGSFKASVHTVDDNGNWAQSDPLDFDIRDGDAPVISARVVPDEQEVRENVTFRASVSDASNVTVQLVVALDNQVVTNATLEHDEGDNYSVTLNFTDVGDYTWRIQALDGNEIPLRSVEVPGALSIRDNLGPRHEIRSPGFVSDGERFGSASARIEVLVYDSDDVENATLRMRIDDTNVTPRKTRADAPLNGYILTYDLAGAYEHNDTVLVTINATDLSNKSLQSELAFSFRVDDQKPLSRAAQFEPRYLPAQDRAWYVSLDTQFTLAADDNDGLPTSVGSITYRIFSDASSTPRTTYGEPFTLRDAMGDVYTGPRDYFLEFVATDDVGNREAAPTLLALYVDATAPALDPFGTLPQGRFVNATFLDKDSGVDRAVVWYRVDDGPYRPVALEFDGELWRAALPEGRKGENVAYYLQAWDRVNNTRTEGNETHPYHAYTVGNHLPTLRIEDPALGKTVSRTLDLTWAASDEDGDPLTFIVYLKAPGRTSFVELATLTAAGARTYALDTTRYPDGQYVIAVTAGDGTFVTRAETTVTFLNSGAAVGDVSAPEGRLAPDESFLITAEINKAQAQVEARIHRDGNLVQTLTMNDDGRDGDVSANDGIYSVRAAVARAGTYSVEIVTRYQENGELKEDRTVDAASFTVRLTPGAILTEYALVWTALVVLALAAVGVAGYGLYRKWR